MSEHDKPFVTGRAATVRNIADEDREIDFKKGSTDYREEIMLVRRRLLIQCGNFRHDAPKNTASKILPTWSYDKNIQTEKGVVPGNDFKYNKTYDVRAR